MNTEAVEVIAILAGSATAGILYSTIRRLKRSFERNSAAEVFLNVLLVTAAVVMVLAPVGYLAVLGPTGAGRAARQFASKYLTAPAVCCLLGLMTPMLPTLGGLSAGSEHPSQSERLLPQSVEIKDESPPTPFVMSLFPMDRSYDICTTFVEDNTRRDLFAEATVPAEAKFESILLRFASRPPKSKPKKQKRPPPFDTLLSHYLGESLPVSATPVRRIPRVSFDNLMSHYITKSVP